MSKQQNVVQNYIEKYWEIFNFRSLENQRTKLHKLHGKMFFHLYAKLSMGMDLSISDFCITDFFDPSLEKMIIIRLKCFLYCYEFLGELL